MKHLPTTAISLLSALCIAFASLPSSWQSALADQNDGRLDALFVRLLEAPGPGEAQRVEGMIWSIWVQSGDGAVRILMRDGIESMSRGDYQRALSKFEQIVLIAPDFAEGWNKRATVHYLLGLVYVELEDERRALKAFEAALAIHPNMTSAAFNAAQLRKLLRDREI